MMDTLIKLPCLLKIAKILALVIVLCGCEEDDRIFRTFEPPLPTVADEWSDKDGNPIREGGRVIDIENPMLSGEQNLSFIVDIHSNDRRKITQIMVEYMHLASPFESVGISIGYIPWDTVLVSIPDVQFTFHYSSSYLEMSKLFYHSVIPAVFSIPIMGTNGCFIPDPAFQCKIVCERTIIRLTVYFDDASSVVLAPMTIFTVFNSAQCQFE